MYCYVVRLGSSSTTQHVVALLIAPRWRWQRSRFVRFHPHLELSSCSLGSLRSVRVRPVPCDQAQAVFGTPGGDGAGAQPQTLPLAQGSFTVSVLCCSC